NATVRTLRTVKQELRAAAIDILPDRPDIACIEKKGPFHLPEDLEAVFQIHFQFEITCLIKSEVIVPVQRIGVLIPSRAKPPGCPGPNAVRTTHIELFDIRHIRRKAKGPGDAKIKA